MTPACRALIDRAERSLGRCRGDRAAARISSRGTARQRTPRLPEEAPTGVAEAPGLAPDGGRRGDGGQAGPGAGEGAPDAVSLGGATGARPARHRVDEEPRCPERLGGGGGRGGEGFGGAGGHGWGADL